MKYQATAHRPEWYTADDSTSAKIVYGRRQHIGILLRNMPMWGSEEVYGSSRWQENQGHRHSLTKKHEVLCHTVLPVRIFNKAGIEEPEAECLRWLGKRNV